MECREVHEKDVIEGYLLGNLEQSDQEAFEAHFFECEDCFEELETLRGVQQELESRGVPRLAQRPSATVKWWWWALAAAAGLTLAVTAVIWWTVADAPPMTAALSPELAGLATIEPPNYEAIRLRGVSDESQQRFRKAMELYAAGDFTAAIPGLEEAAELDPEAPNISFFLGACYLLTDRTPDGIAELEHSVSLGDTPFLEEAYLLLAKAHIGTGELDAARPELQAVIDLGGDFTAEARALMDELSK